MRLQPTLDFAESPSATYLCTVFGLFHKAGHELLAGHEPEFARAVGIKDADTANAIEAGIDLLAYAGYTAYVNSASADATLEPLVRALIHPPGSPWALPLFLQSPTLWCSRADISEHAKQGA